MPDPAEGLQIRGLAAVARALGRSAQLATMVELAAEEATTALRAASVSISRLEPGTGTIRTLINVGRLGPDEQRWPEQEVYRLDDFMQLQGVVGELRIWTMAVDDPGADRQEVALLRSLGKGSSMGAPLVVDGKLWGELYATREAGADGFSETDEAYTEALCAILSGAVSRALHVDSLEQLAFHDPLTGLSNRRALDDAARTAFDPIAGRSGRRVSVVTLDLNGLKTVNDRYGHGEGDQFLVQVANFLKQGFSTLHGSLVARVGGDEFTVLVPGHDVSLVVAAAEVVCRQTRGLAIGEGLACGIATTTEMGNDIAKRLFIAADAAQYSAKRQGLVGPLSAAAPYGYDSSPAITPPRSPK